MTLPIEMHPHLDGRHDLVTGLYLAGDFLIMVSRFFVRRKKSHLSEGTGQNG